MAAIQMRYFWIMAWRSFRLISFSNYLVGVFCIISFAFAEAVAQNLVPNHSFEDYSECPTHLSGLGQSFTPPWRSPGWANYYETGTYSSPDFFNRCTNSALVDVPKNFHGYQHPQHGDGYAGIYVQSTGFNSREYLQVELLEKLKAGHIYYVGFYFNLGDTGCPGNRIGLRFSADTIPPDGESLFSYEPHAEYTAGWMADTAEWVILEDCYVATGEEKYLTIGNFRNDDESDLKTPCTPQAWISYYYIDNVFVVDMSAPDLGEDFSLCPGDEAVLSVAAGNSTYVWQDQSTDDSLLINVPGVYHVTATNVCGTNSDTIVVAPDFDPPVISLPDQITICTGETYLLETGVSNADHLWSLGSALQSLLVSDPGLYSVTVTNGCGSDRDTVKVIDGGDAPTVDLGDTLSLCPGEILLVNPISSNVEAWQWHDGSILPNITINSPGTISVMVTNPCGATADTAHIIATNAAPAAELGDDVSACTGDTILLSANVVGVDYLWQDGNVSSTLAVTTAGSYHLTVSNACGSSSDTVDVSYMNGPMKPQLGSDTTLCEGEAIALTWEAGQEVQYVWNTGWHDETFFVDAPGEYVLTVINGCGSSSDSILVSFIQSPADFDLGSDTVICGGEEFYLSVPAASGNAIWQDGNQGVVYLVNDSQLYTATIKNQCGMASDSIFISVNLDIPQYPVDQPTQICPDSMIQLDVIQPFAASYEWATGERESVFTAELPGHYTVEVTTVCFSRSFDFEITTSDSCLFASHIYAPTVFSPNGDGINDSWQLFITDKLFLLEMRGEIFDRWGNMVFSTSTPPFTWDGTQNKQPLNPGVYTYLVSMTYNKLGKVIRERRTGDLTLLR